MRDAERIEITGQNGAGSAAAREIREHILEIVSDSGEGAQTAGKAFGAIAARMGHGVWTVEIIPAEIEPPARTIAGASGNRIRIASSPVTNMGDQADLIVAFNEQTLLNRVQGGHLKKNCIILIENKWRDDPNEHFVRAYTETFEQLVEIGFQVFEIPMEKECLKIVDNPRRGKNIFVLGVLAYIYSLEKQVAREQIAFFLGKKGEEVIKTNYRLLDAGYAWAREHLSFRYTVPSAAVEQQQIVINGNIAVAQGIMASGMEVCAMYPITPATSASHYLSEAFESVGGLVHQAEDEIAACAFAIGASYAGKCAVTITSGPGLALKTELIGLASMAEIPLVIVDVQRGGPSTGLPTKVEQSDLLAAIFGAPGDSPKVVLAPATIEDCFYSIITARKIAETFRLPVIVLSDAALATSWQPIPRPRFREEWLASPVDLSPVPDDVAAYDWHPKTGLSRRFLPGQVNGIHTVTGLAHTRNAKVAYDPTVNQEASNFRSLKLASLQKTLKTPKVCGDQEGDLLLIGWGSTKGAIEEAVARVRQDGLKVSSLHLKYLLPMASGIREILKGFQKVMTVEINFSDDPEHEMINEDNRRYANLAWLLRARFLVDIDSFSNVAGQPISPGMIEEMIRSRINKEISTT